MSVRSARRRAGGTAAVALGWLVGCAAPVVTSPQQSGHDPRPLEAVALTEPAIDRQPESPALWLHPSDDAAHRLYALDEDRGVEVYDFTGRRLADWPLGALKAAAVGYAPQAGWPDLLALATASGDLRLFKAGEDAQRELARLSLDDAAERLCFHRHPESGALFLFAADDRGSLTQLQVLRATQGFALREIRRFAVGGEIEGCAADDRAGMLYVSEDQNAVWRYQTDPERPLQRRAVDVAAPLGGLAEPKGLAVISAVDGSRLLVADEGQGAIRVYDTQRVGGVAHAVSAVPAPQALAAAGNDAEGWVVVGPADEDGAPRFSVLALDAVLAAAGLPLSALHGPRDRPTPSMPSVMPSAETEPVSDDGDAADDPAIWVHPDDPSRSLIIGSQKQYGLLVYGLDGRLRQSLPAGRINNVDVRDGFVLDGRVTAIVAGSNRSDDSIALYRIDPQSGRLEDVADGRLDTGFADPYGLCLYASPTGAHYVIVNDTEGRVRQWRLDATGSGRVTTTLVREFAVGSQTEGCVADETHGWLYVGEENVALWRYGAEPDAGDARVRVDHVGAGGHLTADIEGVALWRGVDGAGWLVVSSQGEDAYAVYERDGDQRYVGHFRIVADDVAGIDGASETDGLEVSSADLGGPYARGLLVVQDGRNVAPEERQNFKLVPWAAVERALGLPSLQGVRGAE